WFTRAVYYQQFIKWAESIRKPAFPDLAIAGISYVAKDNNTTAILKTNAIAYLAKKYPGKAIYIDVYATWCGPCIEEIKLSPPVHNAMEGKDIVFVNLCLASEMDKWKTFIKERALDGENFFFNGDASQLFMGNYKLSGYPSYLLINKKGEIVTTTAPRPSDFDHLTKTLNKLAAE
ncbi:MAG: TlpA disulfide reductase family protein, partial [Bacteroidota bacterium]